MRCKTNVPFGAKKWEWESADRKKPQKSTCPEPAAPPFLKFWVEVKKKKVFSRPRSICNSQPPASGRQRPLLCAPAVLTGSDPPEEGAEEL